MSLISIHQQQSLWYILCCNQFLAVCCGLWSNVVSIHYLCQRISLISIFLDDGWQLDNCVRVWVCDVVETWTLRVCVRILECSERERAMSCHMRKNWFRVFSLLHVSRRAEPRVQSRTVVRLICFLDCDWSILNFHALWLVAREMDLTLNRGTVTRWEICAVF